MDLVSFCVKCIDRYLLWQDLQIWEAKLSWRSRMKMLWLLSSFKRLCYALCVSVSVHVSHIPSTSLLIYTYAGWCLIKWEMLKLNLPMSEGNTAKDQLATLEVNMSFTPCVSIYTSIFFSENTEDVCAGSASQTLSIRSSPGHHTAVTGQSYGETEALCRHAGLEEQQCNKWGWRQRGGIGHGRCLHSNSLQCIWLCFAGKRIHLSWEEKNTSAFEGGLTPSIASA